MRQQNDNPKFRFIRTSYVSAEKFTVRMPIARHELTTPGLQTQCSSDIHEEGRKGNYRESFYGSPE